jgi:hypothetical protein
MPNWVENRISIVGDTETIYKIKEQLRQPIKVQVGIGKTGIAQPVFSFHNIVTFPEDKEEEYFGTYGSERDPVTGEIVKTGETPFNWYNFNNREWGTKWDVANEASLLETDLGEGQLMLQYTFQTAWSFPEPAIDKLASQYPTVEIEAWWEEEQGFGEIIAYKDGNAEIIDEWDTVSSHDDSVKRYGECSCQYAETPDDLPFSDCAVQV